MIQNNDAIQYKETHLIKDCERFPTSTLEHKNSRSLLSKANSRINYFQTRMKMIEDEILKDSGFIRPTLKHSNIKEMKKNKATSVNRVNAIIGTTEVMVCLGILVIGENGNLHLEDETMRVPINLSKANSDRSTYFTEGSIVLVEGKYRSGILWADFLSQPPLISKPTKREISENDRFGAYTYVKNNILNKIEEIDKLAIRRNKTQEKYEVNENEGIVIMSKLCLDEPNSIETLDEIFTAYEQVENISTFILCGEFISLKMVDSIDFEGIKFYFDELARIIKKNDRLKNE